MRNLFSLLALTALLVSAPTLARTPEPNRPAAVTAATPAADHALHYTVTDASFAKDVLEASKTKPILVEFFAPWCGFCRKQAPVVEALVKEYGGTFRVARLDAEAYPQIADRERVATYPTIVLYQNGQRIFRSEGIMSKEELVEFLAIKNVRPAPRPAPPTAKPRAPAPARESSCSISRKPPMRGLSY